MHATRHVEHSAHGSPACGALLRPLYHCAGRSGWRWSQGDRVRPVAGCNGNGLGRPSAEAPSGQELWRADHVHVENWWVNDALPDAPPILASNQVETNIVGGVESTNSATSNYGFIDGHVETLPFNKVYVRPGNNRFDPKVNSFLN